MAFSKYDISFLIFLTFITAINFVKFNFFFRPFIESEVTFHQFQYYYKDHNKKKIFLESFYF
jgi:hypothetical protein